MSSWPSIFDDLMMSFVYCFSRRKCAFQVALGPFFQSDPLPSSMITMSIGATHSMSVGQKFSQLHFLYPKRSRSNGSKHFPLFLMAVLMCRCRNLNPPSDSWFARQLFVQPLHDVQSW